VRATTIKCPECGAIIAAAPDAEVAKCEYCGAAAQIQRRSPILQRPMPVRAPQPGEPQLPVATSTKAIGAIGCSVMLLGILAGIAVPIVMGVRGCKKDAETNQALESPRWDGVDSIVLQDLDGDGVEDVIGRVRVLQPTDRLMVAAFNGANGERLWISEVLGTRGDLLHSPMGVTSEVVLVGDGSAGVIALSVADGGTRWRIRLNEVVEKFCAGGADGAVRVMTKDEKLHPVAVADGALQPAGEGAECMPLASDSARADQPGRITYGRGSDYRELVLGDKADGMSARQTLHHIASGATIALGHKKPGSRVPMIASYSWPEQAEVDESEVRDLHAQISAEKDQKRRAELFDQYRAARRKVRVQREKQPDVGWTAVVPGVDPLTANDREPEPENADLNGAEVVIAYEMKDTHRFRLTAFSIADGKRKWDIALPGERPLSAVVVSPTHAMVSRWDGLYVYGLATGAHAYTIK